MRVLLVNPPVPDTVYSFHKAMKMLRKKAMAPPLGLLTVAGLLPRDWDFKLVELTFEELRPADWDRCDVVMTTGSVLQEAEITEVIRMAKRRGKTVVVGGPWAFHFPDAALEAGADLVVPGEAEPVIDELVEKLRRGITGVVIESNGRADMRSVPPARFDLVELDSYLWMPIQWSRGCPFRCEYCDVTHMFGHPFRHKDPGQVLRELDILRDLGWKGLIFVVDDSFTSIPELTENLLTELITWMDSHGRPFQFRGQTTANVAEHDRLLGLLVQAGFHSIYLGIESTDPETLAKAGKVQYQSIDLDEACRKVNRAGLGIWAGFMIGFDDEQPGVDERVIDFVTRNDLPEVLISPLQALPGTRLWKRLEKEGRLFPDSSRSIAKQSRLLNFAPRRPMAEIARELANIYDALYEPGAYLDRSYRHIQHMTPLNNGNSRRRPERQELLALAIAVFRHGVLYSSRGTFWRIVYRLLRDSPERLESFLLYCFLAEDFFEFRRKALKEYAGASDQAPAGFFQG